MHVLTTSLQRFYTAFLLLGGVVWASDVLLWLDVSLIDAEWLGIYLGIAIAAAFLHVPYGKKAGTLDILLGFVGMACWGWMAWNFQDWLVDFEGPTPSKFVPGAIAIIVMMEALRKASGLPIAILVWVLIFYGLFGHVIPGPLQAHYQRPVDFIMYIYADTNAVPGLVLVIIAGMVLAFIVFGKLMEVSGATNFFTDLAMSVMGHKRGGPAKVAVVGSSLFGSISSSPVGNIMSTGVVTIPLMKKTGFKPHYAAAIEAVASTGGQIAPPVMGATAFLMAEFLQINYFDVVVAAALPALFYYLCLFMQVDAVAVREGLQGVPKAQLPRFLAVVRRGWGFLLPLAVLIYMLFWRGATPAFAALVASAVLLVFALVGRKMRTRADWGRFIFGGGAGMIPLVMIGAAAGVVVGVMNASGLGQSLSFILVDAGASWGLLPMLIITAVLCIILGMGMPTTAIYVILATVLAPALTKMGMTQMAAHLFIFYFGVMSFLTPPVAVSSYVAAGLAKASMWKTGWIGLRLSSIAMLLPFVWAFDPALLLDGSPMAIGVVVATTTAAIFLISRGFVALQEPGDRKELLTGLGLVLLAFGFGSSPIWLGSESWVAGAAALFAIAGCWLVPARQGAELRNAPVNTPA